MQGFYAWKLSLITILILFNSLVTLYAETCIASIYDTSEGTGTASGIPLNDNALTAAHKFLPFNRKVRVTNISNGKEVIVKITDRGPFVRGRCIDLTKAAGKVIGCNDLCKVSVE